MSYNKTVIVGNLGRDPEMRYLPDGKAVTNMSVATNRQFTKSNGEKVKQTTWFRVSAWGKQAESIHQYLKSGAQVLVEGQLTADENGGPRVYKKADGTPAASFEISADRVVFLSSKSGGESEAQSDF